MSSSTASVIVHLFFMMMSVAFCGIPLNMEPWLNLCEKAIYVGNLKQEDHVN